MKSVAFQLAGVAVIVLGIGGAWMLDLYGCAFNTMGCNRVLPRFHGEMLAFVVVVGAIGLALFGHGRRLRRLRDAPNIPPGPKAP
ncbi:hypothetical protein [Salinarimonas chemoclinalis]|uniref:hypothetical protein n=1 Tax=Salinarimonas chemoclinalis TaxID=3241599 RepID=UPI00355633B6